MNKLSTFIMAGGKGERLFPLTMDRAKPAVPFGGIYRIIDFTLSNCINSGIRRIHVLTQYKSISLARHLRIAWNIFDDQLGEFIDVIPAQQRVDDHWYQGTADSIYQNIYSIDMEEPEDVLILAGDHLYKMNYADIVMFHREINADLTISVVEIEKEKADQFGVLDVDINSKVVGFEEKPSNPEIIAKNPDKVYASMGIYVFKKDLLEEELHDDAKRQSHHDFGKNIIPAMIKKGRFVAAYNFKDENKKESKYWRDIGTIDAYFKANMDLVEVSPVFNLYDRDWPIRTYQGQFPPAKTVFAQEQKLGRLGVALDSLISNGCIISGGRVERSIISCNVRVNSYSHVADSIIMENTDIGRHAKIRRAIIDKNVKIAPGVQIGYDLEKDKKRFTVTDSGIVVVSKGTIVND